MMVTRNPLELPQNGRWLGLDVGEARVGLAISDSGRSVAMVRGFCGRKWADLKPELAKMQAEGAVAAVVGYPLNMDGTEGVRGQSVRDLAAHMEQDLGLPVLLWDERLTSRAVEAAFFEHREGRQTRASKKASVGRVDGGAAALILETALGRLRA